MSENMSKVLGALNGIPHYCRAAAELEHRLQAGREAGTLSPYDDIVIDLAYIVHEALETLTAWIPDGQAEMTLLFNLDLVAQHGQYIIGAARSVLTALDDVEIDGRDASTAGVALDAIADAAEDVISQYISSRRAKHSVGEGGGEG